MKRLSCKDAGVDCDYVATGQTDDEVLRNASEHGKKTHGIKDFTIEMKNKLTSLIRDVKNK